MGYDSFRTIDLRFIGSNFFITFDLEISGSDFFRTFNSIVIGYDQFRTLSLESGSSWEYNPFWVEFEEEGYDGFIKISFLGLKGF